MDTKKMRACAPLLPPPGNEVVCECLDEIERLRAEAREADALREKLAGILSRTAVSLRGPEPPLTRWSWHDLPERAAAAIAAIDVMQRAALMAAQDLPPNAELRGAKPIGEASRSNDVLDGGN